MQTLQRNVLLLISGKATEKNTKERSTQKTIETETKAPKRKLLAPPGNDGALSKKKTCNELEELKSAEKAMQRVINRIYDLAFVQHTNTKIDIKKYRN